MLLQLLERDGIGVEHSSEQIPQQSFAIIAELFSETPAPLLPVPRPLTGWTEVNAAREKDSIVGGSPAKTLIVAAFEDSELHNFRAVTVMSSVPSGISPHLDRLPASADRNSGSTTFLLSQSREQRERSLTSERCRALAHPLNADRCLPSPQLMHAPANPKSS